MPSEARVSIVTGKGGVGKTTVALALGRALARAGATTLVLDLGSGLGLTAAAGAAVRHEPTAAPSPPGLELASTDPTRAVDDLVLGASPSRRIAARLLRLGSLRAFLGAAPGVLEVALLARLDALARSGRYEHVVVDADATGHLQMLLATPALLGRLGVAGPIARALDAVSERLGDPARTSFHVVTLPTVLALEETRALTRALRARELRLGTLFVARATPRDETRGVDVEALARRLASTPAAEDVRALAAQLAERARLDSFLRHDAADFRRVVELADESVRLPAEAAS